MYNGPYRTPQPPPPRSPADVAAELLAKMRAVERVIEKYDAAQARAQKAEAEALKLCKEAQQLMYAQTAPADTLSELWRLRRFITVLRKWVNEPCDSEGFKAAQAGVRNLLAQLEAKVI